MSSEPGKIDRLMDEALQDLTAGVPRDGFRERVMTRIRASSEPSRVRFVEILGWRVRPAHLVAAGALAACALLAALVLPSLLSTSTPSSVQTRTAANPPAAAPSIAAAAPAAAPTPMPTATPHAADQLQVANTPAQPQPRRATVQRAADMPATPAADEKSGTLEWVTVDPLPAPDPIVNEAIDISPVEIEPLTIPEIQVPALEAGGAARSPGPAK
jgi:hypothetical protein